MALPSLPPLGPLAAELYVLTEMYPCDDSVVIGRCWWKRDAMWDVMFVSLMLCVGNAAKFC